MRIRSLVMLAFCLAFLATRVGGLHFHVSDHDHPPEPAVHEVEHGHSAPHLTSELADDHLAGHASHDERDVVSADAGLIAKLPTSGLPLLFLALWSAFALRTRVASGRLVPIEWLRPPPNHRWPPLLLPPSQGPPRAV
jgi:hypothetical protein